MKLQGWPSDDDAQAWDLVCARCNARCRLNPSDVFVAQVRLFLDQHRHLEDG